jgi:methylmalonyl-CoA mutase, N-terminal domain
VEKEERIIVGVNRHEGSAGDPDMDLHTVDESIRETQSARLSDLKESRDNAAVARALDRLTRAAEGEENVLYPMKEALGELATVGEVSDRLRDVFGEHRPA